MPRSESTLALATPEEAFVCVPILDHVRLAQLFVDEFGVEIIDAVRVSKDAGELIEDVKKRLDATGDGVRFRGRRTEVSEEFADEVAWICLALSDSIVRHERHLKLLRLYNHDHRHLLAFVLRPIVQSFEPTQELAELLDMSPSSLSRWASGKARPQKIVRKVLMDRLERLTRATLGTLLELDHWLTTLMDAVGLDRRRMEAECQRLLDEVDGPKGSDKVVHLSKIRK